jgi:hypothetical protein
VQIELHERGPFKMILAYAYKGKKVGSPPCDLCKQYQQFSSMSHYQFIETGCTGID